MAMQGDLFDARRWRDEAISRVASNGSAFVVAGLERIRLLPAGLYTGEDIRFALEGDGLEPHHPNAWGALTLAAVRAKLIEPIQEFRQMTSLRSHARVTRVYKVTR